MRKILIGLFSILIILILFITLSISNDVKKNAKAKEERIKEREIKAEEFIQEEKEKKKEELLNLNLSHETTLSELDEILHSMSHQKVIADDKWSKIPLVDETVNQLVEYLESNPPILAEDDDSRVIAESIIYDWAKGDFSNAAEHHNRVWRDLGGTVGEAYGTMTKGEERDYITMHFGNDFMDYLIETDQWQD